jgi:hypothetical protein
MSTGSNTEKKTQFDKPRLILTHGEKGGVGKTTVACALVIALGTGFGGMRVIRTLGHKIIKLSPIHGFTAETVAAITIQVVTLLKVPISTTHVISSSILGIGGTAPVTGAGCQVVPPSADRQAAATHRPSRLWQRSPLLPTMTSVSPTSMISSPTGSSAASWTQLSSSVDRYRPLVGLTHAGTALSGGGAVTVRYRPSDNG